MSAVLATIGDDELLLLVADHGLDNLVERFKVDRPTLLRRVRQVQRAVATRDAKARREIAVEHVREVAAGKISDDVQRPVLPHISAAIQAAKKQLANDARALVANVSCGPGGMAIDSRSAPIERIREVLAGTRADDPEHPIVPHVLAALNASNQQVEDVFDDLIASGALDGDAQ